MSAENIHLDELKDAVDACDGQESAQTFDSAPTPLNCPDRLDPGKLSTRSGNMILMILFIAGLGGVYLLSCRSGPAKASAQQILMEAKVDTALSELSKVRADEQQTQQDNRDVTNVFYYEAKHRQIPASQLHGNPFVFRPPVAQMPSPLPKAQSTSETDHGEARELSEAMQAVRGLTLQSVLTGTHGATATISNNLLTEGQRIRGWTVNKILPHHVVLEWKQHTHVLKMPE